MVAIHKPISAQPATSNINVHNTTMIAWDNCTNEFVIANKKYSVAKEVSDFKIIYP